MPVFLQVVDGKLRVQFDSTALLDLINGLFQQVSVHAHHNVAVHLDEPAVAVEGEPLVPAAGGKALDGVVIQAQVQNRVHHARHGNTGSRANRKQQGVVRIGEFLAHDRLDLGQGLLHVRFQGIIQSHCVLILDTLLGGHGKARGNRNTQSDHFSQICSLAAQQILHSGMPIGLPVTEKIRPLAAHDNSKDC